MTLDCTIDEKEDTQSKVIKQETVRLQRDSDMVEREGQKLQKY